MALGGSGIALGLRGQPVPSSPNSGTNAVSMPAGKIFNLPAGNWYLTLGPYTSLQFLDPVSGLWRTTGANASLAPQYVVSDGGNYRIANLTGCPVGAIITTALATGATTGIGSAVNGMSATPSTGSSTWQTIVGGALSTTCVTGVTGSTVGAGYTFPPLCVISAPPAGGLQATATATVTGGALLAAQVTITNQGAGYPVKSTGISTATIIFVNDPRDTTGAGATVLLGATGTGSLTALVPLTPGNPNTVVPTFTFGVGAAGATMIMNFTVTTFVTGLTSMTWLTGTTPLLVSIGNLINTATTVPVWTNPIHSTQITFPRPARIQTALSTNTIVVANSLIEDAGFGIQQVPNLQAVGISLGLTGATTGSVPQVATVGGTTDTCWLQAV